MADDLASPEAAAPAAVNPLDQLVEKYIALRDRKAALKGDYEKSVAKIDEALGRIEAYLLTQLTATGSESVRTKSGTFYKSERISATVADWDHIREWVLDAPAERWSMLEKRVSKGFVEAYKTEHNDLPPGVNIRSEIVVNVRRS